MSIDIKAPWQSVIDGVTSIIGKVIPDRAAAAAATAQYQTMVLSGQLQEEMLQLQAITSAQSDINKVEAASTDSFTSRWRPFIGWVCGTGLAVQFLVRPFVMWGCNLVGHPTDFPSLDMGTLLTLLGGLLGLGAMRTTEKLKGVA